MDALETRAKKGERRLSGRRGRNEPQELERRQLPWLFLATFATLLLLHQGAITVSDGDSVYAVTRSLITKGTFAVPENLGIPGGEGQYFSRYGLGLSLVSIPLFLVGSLLQKVQGPGEDVTRAVVSCAIPLASALLVVAMYVLCRRIGANGPNSLLVALGTIFGTFLFPYAKDFFSEPLAALGLVWSIGAAVAGRPVSAGAGAGLACLTRPQTLVFVPLLLWRVWKDTGLPGLYRCLIPLAPCGLTILGYNMIRFDDPLNFGYPDSGLTTPLLTGITGLLASPTKSLFLFAPAVLLAILGLKLLWQKSRTGFWLITGNFALNLFISAKWAYWQGGWAWGPRLVIPGLPPLLAAVALWMGTSRARKVIASSFFAAGLLVSLPAIIVPTQAQQLNHPQREAPSIFRQYRFIEPTASRSLAEPFERERGHGAHRKYLSFWQLAVISVFGKKGVLIALFGSAALVGVLVWSTVCLVRSFRLLKTEPGPPAPA